MKSKDTTSRRLRIEVSGAVQGVGFRPFVFRIANDIGVKGWVCNSPQGAVIEAEGREEMLRSFLQSLRTAAPEHADIRDLRHSNLEPAGYCSFEMRDSRLPGPKTAARHCDVCGLSARNLRPRRSPIPLSYEDPSDRRFHAQPNACPECGPQIRLRGSGGTVVGERHEAVLQAAACIRGGGIVAMKGIGGFHLIVDGRNAEAVTRLRERKLRDEKPPRSSWPKRAV